LNANGNSRDRANREKNSHKLNDWPDVRFEYVVHGTLHLGCRSLRLSGVSAKLGSVPPGCGDAVPRCAREPLCAAFPFVPAKSGEPVQESNGRSKWHWIPACAGMNGVCGSVRTRRTPLYRGSVVEPIRNLSTACAAWRPSRIAHTTSDWPRRM